MNLKSIKITDAAHTALAVYKASSKESMVDAASSLILKATSPAVQGESSVLIRAVEKIISCGCLKRGNFFIEEPGMCGLFSFQSYLESALESARNALQPSPAPVAPAMPPAVLGQAPTNKTP